MDHEDLGSVAKSLLSKSSIFAVAQLVTSSGFSRKILWLVVLLVGLFGCSYEIYRFLNLYFQYPVVITLEVENNWKLDFPAVTVCNLNRIPTFYYNCLLSNLTVDECLNLSCENIKRITRKNDVKFGQPLLFSERQNFASCSNEGTFSERHQDLLHFLNIYLNATDEERKQLGHNATSFITSCTFNGAACSIGNFSDFLSVGFGNCFTFNAKYNTDEKSIETSYIGPNSGLELTFNVQRSDYSLLAPSVGIRVVIHEAYSLPNPDDHGINISPQYETSVALRQTAVYRLPHPYRDQCKDYDEERKIYSNQETCIWQCMQNKNLENCGCIDPFLPRKHVAKLCDLQNQSEVCCLDEVVKSLSEEGTPCPCPLPCRSVDYEMTLSTAEWPTSQFYKMFLVDEPKPISHPCTSFETSTLDELRIATTAETLGTVMGNSGYYAPPPFPNSSYKDDMGNPGYPEAPPFPSNSYKDDMGNQAPPFPSNSYKDNMGNPGYPEAPPFPSNSYKDDMGNQAPPFPSNSYKDNMGNPGYPEAPPFPINSYKDDMGNQAPPFPSNSYKDDMGNQAPPFPSDSFEEDMGNPRRYFASPALSSDSLQPKFDSYEEDRTNIAKLKVFYKTLEKSYYKQEPMFQESELFSQLGGQLGLWLGVSLVALFECLENISHLIHYCIKKSSEKRKEPNIPPPKEKTVTI